MASHEPSRLGQGKPSIPASTALASLLPITARAARGLEQAPVLAKNNPAAAHMIYCGHKSCWVLHESHRHPADSCPGHEFTTASGTRREPYKLVNWTHLYPLLALDFTLLSLPSTWISALKLSTEAAAQISVSQQLN